MTRKESWRRGGSSGFFYVQRGAAVTKAGFHIGAMRKWTESTSPMLFIYSLFNPAILPKVAFGAPHGLLWLSPHQRVWCHPWQTGCLGLLATGEEGTTHRALRGPHSETFWLAPPLGLLPGLQSWPVQATASQSFPAQ